MPPDWLNLPDELLVKVATSCSGILIGMRGTCKVWKVCLDPHATGLTIRKSGLPFNLPDRFPMLAKLDLQGCDPMPTHPALRSLLTLPSLTSLALKLPATELTPNALSVLQDLGPRTSLLMSVWPEDITTPLMDSLRALGLARLDLEQIWMWGQRRHYFTNAHLGQLVDLPISQLDLSRTATSDAGLPALLRMPIIDLNLAGTPLTDAGLSLLGGMSLRSLDMSDCSLVSDVTVEVLRGLPLTCLNLGGLTRVSDPGLNVLRSLPLTSLGLCNRISDLGLGMLRGLPLTRLHLGDASNNFSRQALEILRGMPLTDLNASGISSFSVELVRGAPLRKLALAKMEDLDGMQLEDLEVRSCANMTPGRNSSEFLGLREMPLRRLHICNGPKMTNSEFSLLYGLPLTDLSLDSFNSITDEGLMCLHKMSLRFLTIVRCQQISFSGAHRISGNAKLEFDSNSCLRGDNEYNTARGGSRWDIVHPARRHLMD